ncbi:MAG: PEP-utilizing enzyme, partial [Candidatus Promineifilaceae bacterium]|nr:PEP-utilizing enzyme [Candidatus Promineifilaceae bacterium]
LKETTVGAKEMMIVPAGGRHTTTEPVSDVHRSQTTLNADQLKALGAIGIAVEKHFGGVPQDIEWAWDGERFWLLQARPITNLPPAPLRDVRWEPLRPGTVWMRRQVVEHMPEPLSPLFDELYLQKGLDQSLAEMAKFMSDISGIQIDIWEFIQPPFAATINGYAYSIASFNMSRTMIPKAMRIYIQVLPKMIRHLVPYWREGSLPRYREVVKYWKEVDLQEQKDVDLLRGMRELAYEDAVYWFAAAVPLGLARMSDAALNAFLKRMSPKIDPARRTRLISGSYLRGFPSKASAAQIELEAVATKIRQSAALRPLVLNTAAENLTAVLAEHPQGQAICHDLQAYLDRYGHQIYNLDFAVPTLADDPLPVWLNLKTAVAYPERDAKTRQQQLARERHALEAKTQDSLNPLERWIFRLLLRWAQRYAPYREEALFYVGWAWPTLRRLAHELGRRLTMTASLAEADDVFYLYTAELIGASNRREGDETLPDLARMAQERRELRAARQRLDPPVAVPEDGRMKFGPIDMAFFEPKPRTAGSGPRLSGFGVSPGRVTAPASVIHSAQDFAKMEANSILVCTTTTPAWTPLFAQARGLVTDIGGALAHGSIVAREYGIPAVMGTGNATARIQPGQMIAVDGDAGTVTLVDEAQHLDLAGAESQPRLSSSRKLAVAGLSAGLIFALLAWLRRRGK